MKLVGDAVCQCGIWRSPRQAPGVDKATNKMSVPDALHGLPANVRGVTVNPRTLSAVASKGETVITKV
jgi:hypothetical protein